MNEASSRSKSKERKEKSKEKKEPKDQLVTDKDKKSEKSEKSKSKKSHKSSSKKDDDKEKRKSRTSGLDLNTDFIKDINVIDDNYEKRSTDRMNAIPSDRKYRDYYPNDYQSHQQNNLNHNSMNKKIVPSSREVERCDGCFDGEAEIFCVNCEKVFCQDCEDQIHIVPVNRLHERMAVTNVFHLKKLCYHHHNSLKYYCESCEEPVCHECQLIGPHNNKLHRIINIFESFKKKFGSINHTVQKGIMNKLDLLTNQIQMIEFNIEQIRDVKNSIERDIRGEYSNLMENLRSEEGKKLAILQFESANVNKEINKIQDVINIVNEINMADSPDMIAFLLRYKQLHETVELMLAKPIKQNVEIPADDFSRDLEERTRKLNKYEKMKSLIKAKDDIIWTLLNEKKIREELEFNQLKEKTHNEISEWVKLSDKYALELKKYHLVCYFCGCYLEENTVNSICKKNSNESNERSNITSKSIPLDWLDSKRHYFCSPTKDFEGGSMISESKDNTEKDKLQAQAEIEKNNKASLKDYNNPFENNILNDSKFKDYRRRNTSPLSNPRYSDENMKTNARSPNEIVNGLSSFAYNNNINLYQVFSEFDLEGNGFITQEDLKYAMSKLKFNTTTVEIENLLKFFNIGKVDLIPVKDFVRNFIQK